jgi:hypothetical protein
VIGGLPMDDLGALPLPMPQRTRPMRAFAAIDQLLRDRTSILARITSGKDLAAITRVMVATIAVSMAIVGAALGSYRGGVQIGYAAIKLPLVLLGTAALSAPALTAIGSAAGRRIRLTQDLVLVVTALAFGSLLLTACTPLLLLCIAMKREYHDMILVTVGLFSLAGIAALRMIVQGVRLEAVTAPRGSTSAVLGLCVVFALVGGQLSWALRPYLVRPRAHDVVFVRDVEGSLFDSISQTFDSARGHYARDSAPLPEGEESR